MCPGRQAPSLPAYAINVFLPLVDLTDANGATEFAPGSHKPRRNVQDHSQTFPSHTECSSASSSISFRQLQLTPASHRRYLPAATCPPPPSGRRIYPCPNEWSVGDLISAAEVASPLAGRSANPLPRR